MLTKWLYGCGGIIVGGLVATILFAIHESNTYSRICAYQAEMLQKPGSVGSFCAPGKICGVGGSDVAH